MPRLVSVEPGRFDLEPGEIATFEAVCGTTCGVQTHPCSPPVESSVEGLLVQRRNRLLALGAGSAELTFAPWFGPGRITAELQITGSARLHRIEIDRSRSSIPAHPGVCPASQDRPQVICHFDNNRSVECGDFVTWSRAGAGHDELGDVTLTAMLGGVSDSFTYSKVQDELVGLRFEEKAEPFILDIRRKASLGLTCTWADGCEHSCTELASYSTSDPQVLQAEAGTLNPLSRGSALVTAALMGSTISRPVQVGEIKMIDFQMGPYTLDGCNQSRLASLSPSCLFSDGFSWPCPSFTIRSNSTPEVAFVHGYNLIATGLAGTTFIEAEIPGTTLSKTVEVTAIGPPLGKLVSQPDSSFYPLCMTAQPSSLTISVGHTQALSVSCHYPEGERDCRDYDYWQSSNPDKASVDINGVLTAHETGLATLKFGDVVVGVTVID